MTGRQSGVISDSLIAFDSDTWAAPLTITAIATPQMITDAMIAR